jgi:hypothetical protein
MFDDFDVSHVLFRVTTATLLLQSRHYSVAPFVPSRMLAARIPNAKFLLRESEKHVVLHGELARDRLWSITSPAAGSLRGV